MVVSFTANDVDPSSLRINVTGVGGGVGGGAIVVVVVGVKQGPVLHSLTSCSDFDVLPLPIMQSAPPVVGEGSSHFRPLVCLPGNK